MVTFDKKGYCSLIKKEKQGFKKAGWVAIYNITPHVYVTTPIYIKKTNIFDGKVKAIQIPEERSVDIDTKFDFEVAEFLMKKTKKANLSYFIKDTSINFISNISYFRTKPVCNN